MTGPGGSAESGDLPTGMAKNRGETVPDPVAGVNGVVVRENLQETEVVTPKYRGFLKSFPWTMAC